MNTTNNVLGEKPFASVDTTKKPPNYSKIGTSTIPFLNPIAELREYPKTEPGFFQYQMLGSLLSYEKAIKEFSKTPEIPSIRANLKTPKMPDTTISPSILTLDTPTPTKEAKDY
jgi:hypothetical protein